MFSEVPWDLPQQICSLHFGPLRRTPVRHLEPARPGLWQVSLVWHCVYCLSWIEIHRPSSYRFAGRGFYFRPALVSHGRICSSESASQIGPLVGAEDRADFRNIWTSMEGQCDMRGWSKNSIPTITRLLEQFTAGLQLKVVPAGVHTYEG